MHAHHGGESGHGLADAILAAWLTASGDWVSVLDRDGCILLINPGGRTHLGTTAAEGPIGQPWIGLWPAHEGPAGDALAAAAEGRVGHFRGTTTTLAGTVRYWDVEVAPVLDAEGRLQRVIAVARDVSQERRSEQRLLEIARRVSDNARLETENLRRLLHDAPSIMCVLRGPDHVFELINQAAQQVTGHRDLLGLTAREAFPGKIGDALLPVLDQVFASGEPFVASDAAVKLQRQPGGEREDSFLTLQFQPIRDETGAVAGIFVEGTDITARVRAERALAESEKRLRLAQEVAGIGALEIEVASGVVRGTEQLWRLWGLEPQESLDISALEALVVPEDRARLSTAASRADGSAAGQAEYRIRRPDTGEIRWLARQVEFTQDAAGKPLRMIGVMQDITERREIEEQRALLAREIEHRMKNTLAMVGAIAAQTLTGPALEPARTAFAARLTALGTANDILRQRDWSSAPIRAVVEGALAPHRAAAGQIRIEGPELWINAKQGMALTLGLHELATNAAKYGALSVPEGSISVSWSVDRGAAPALFRLVWQEHGGPTVAPPARRGFGSRLIERVMAADFLGEARIEYAPQGVICLLEAPIDALPGAVSGRGR